MLGLSVVLTPAGVAGLGWVWASVAFPSQLHIGLVLPLSIHVKPTAGCASEAFHVCKVHGEVLAWQSHCATLQSSDARKGVMRSNLGPITLGRVRHVWFNAGRQGG